MLTTDVCKGYIEYYSWNLLESWYFLQNQKVMDYSNNVMKGLEILKIVLNIPGHIFKLASENKFLLIAYLFLIEKKLELSSVEGVFSRSSIAKLCKISSYEYGLYSLTDWIWTSVIHMSLGNYPTPLMLILHMIPLLRLCKLNMILYL